MATAAELRRFFQPLLEQHPDFVRVGRYALITPIRHIVRGIYPMSTSQRDYPRPIWFAGPLFGPDLHINTNAHEWLWPGKPTLWKFSDPEAPMDLCEQVEAVALPLIRPVNDVETFFHFAMRDNLFFGAPLYWNKLNKIVIDAARGDFEAADASAAGFWSAEKYATPTERHEYDMVTQRLCPLVKARDRVGIARLLHEWEATSAKRFKLEKFWQPSPFPIEEQG